MQMLQFMFKTNSLKKGRNQNSGYTIYLYQAASPGKWTIVMYFPS